MADWTLHIISERLLVLSISDAVPVDLCHQIREDLAAKLEDTETRFLVLSAVEVRDMRDAPPPIVVAAELVDAWMREHTHDRSPTLPHESTRSA